MMRSPVLLSKLPCNTRLGNTEMLIFSLTVEEVRDDLAAMHCNHQKEASRYFFTDHSAKRPVKNILLFKCDE